MASFTAFEGSRCVASGSVEEVVRGLMGGAGAGVLVFEDETGKEVDFDLSGTVEEAVARVMPKAGRPRLGVVAREVTLLPRHWEWLERQPSGASGALRRLVDEARKGDGDHRAAADAACRVMSALAGNLAGYEEATRALYARDEEKFRAETAGWPEDVRGYLGRLAGGVFGG